MWVIVDWLLNNKLSTITCNLQINIICGPTYIMLKINQWINSYLTTVFKYCIRLTTVLQKCTITSYRPMMYFFQLATLFVHMGHTTKKSRKAKGLRAVTITKASSQPQK